MKKTTMDKVFDIIAHDNERFARLQSGTLAPRSPRLENDTTQRKPPKSVTKEKPRMANRYRMHRKKELRDQRESEYAREQEERERRIEHHEATSHIKAITGLDVSVISEAVLYLLLRARNEDCK